MLYPLLRGRVHLRAQESWMLGLKPWSLPHNYMCVVLGMSSQIHGDRHDTRRSFVLTGLAEEQK